MKRSESVFEITLGGYSCQIEAKTAQAAARLAFRRMIAWGVIKRQPRTTVEGGWVDTHISIV